MANHFTTEVLRSLARLAVARAAHADTPLLPSVLCDAGIEALVAKEATSSDAAARLRCDETSVSEARRSEWGWVLGEERDAHVPFDAEDVAHALRCVTRLSVLPPETIAALQPLWRRWLAACAGGIEVTRRELRVPGGRLKPIVDAHVLDDDVRLFRQFVLDFSASERMLSDPRVTNAAWRTRVWLEYAQARRGSGRAVTESF